MNQEKEKNPKITPEEMERVVKGAEGQELIALLSEGGGLRAAVEAFKKGDMKGVQAALGPALETERAAELIRKISGKQVIHTEGMEETLNRILNDPDSMAQILSMARSFGMGRESEPPPAPEPTAKDPFFMDEGMLLKMMQLFRVMEHSDPKQDALLCALRAYLAPERQEKLDRAVELARLTRLAGAALGPGGVFGGKVG